MTRIVEKTGELSLEIDIVTTGAADGDALVYDSANDKWVPGTVAAGSMTLDGLLDVDTSTVAPTISQTLVWDGTNWVPGAAGATDVSQLTDVNGLLVHFSGDYVDLINKPPQIVDVTFNSGDGVLTVTRDDGSKWVPDLDGRYVQSVNGNQPDANGNVTVSIGITETGTEAERLAATGTLEGTIWVISNDPDSNKNGLSYIWDDIEGWLEIGGVDQAALDARYLNKEIDGIDQLVDVDTTTVAPIANNVLLWDATASQWIPGSVGSTYLETETFVATAGQTQFTILHTAQGEVHLTRNGSSIPADSYSVAGTNVSYKPIGNLGEALEDGDEITISYVWSDRAAALAPLISDMNDVDTTGRVVGDSLVYDGNNWVPEAPVRAMDDLSDVDMTTSAPVDGNSLIYDGASGNWVPGAVQVDGYSHTFYSASPTTNITVGVGQMATCLVVPSVSGFPMMEGKFTRLTETKTLVHDFNGDDWSVVLHNTNTSVSFTTSYSTTVTLNLTTGKLTVTSLDGRFVPGLLATITSVEEV